MEHVVFRMSDACEIYGLHFRSDTSSTVVVHIHANSYISNYYTHLGRWLAKQGVTSYLLDLRGNGKSEGPRGDVSYTGQYEDDIETVLMKIRERHPGSSIVLGGHSGGSVIALRYAHKYACKEVDALYQFAPIYVNHKKSNPQKNKRSNVSKPKLNYLKLVLAKLLPYFQNIKVVRFPNVGVPLEGRVYQFSYRAIRSFFLDNIDKYYRDIEVPLFLSIGESDEVTDVSFVESIASRCRVSTLSRTPMSDHISIVRKSQNVFLKWLNGLPQSINHSSVKIGN